MEKELSSKEQIKFISEMIYQAKRNFAGERSFYFLLWGWVVSVANFVHYILDIFRLYEAPYLVWLIAIPAAIASIWYGFKKSTTTQVTSHLDKVYASIWIGIIVMIIICLIFMSRINYNHNPIILLFAGLGTFVSGILIKYKPIIIGAIVLWAGACSGLLFSVSNQQLISGIAVFLGYLIPGYMLKKAEKNSV